MKYIAECGFGQGLQNPLKTPIGDAHIPKGMVFALDQEQLQNKVIKDLIAIKRLIPLDSPKGQQILAESQKAQADAAEQTKRETEAKKPKTNWERLGVLIGLASLLAAALIYLFK